MVIEQSCCGEAIGSLMDHGLLRPPGHLSVNGIRQWHDRNDCTGVGVVERQQQTGLKRFEYSSPLRYRGAAHRVMPSSLAHAWTQLKASGTSMKVGTIEVDIL